MTFLKTVVSMIHCIPSQYLDIPTCLTTATKKITQQKFKTILGKERILIDRLIRLTFSWDKGHLAPALQNDWSCQQEYG